VGVPTEVCDAAVKDWYKTLEKACVDFAAAQLPPYYPETELPSYLYPEYNLKKKKTMTTTQKKLTAILDVSAEYDSASAKFPPFASAHEGWAILREEVDELWDEVKKNPATRSNMNLEKEAIQVAAMALRFLVDVCMKGK
jgi:hypothetical protein